MSSGRRRIVNPARAAHMATLAANGWTKPRIADKFGVSVRTVYRVLHDYTEPRRLEPCGSIGAYRRHLAEGGRPCLPCTDANATYERVRRLAATHRHRRRDALGMWLAFESRQVRAK